MQTVSAPAIDPWRLEIVVVRDHSHTSGERAALRRAVEQGLLLRLRQGAYVERSAFESLSLEHQHLVRMRAHAASSDVPTVFSHFSAAVAHGLPVLRHRLHRLHLIAATAAGPAKDVAPHRFAIAPREVVQLHDLLVTTHARTVVDVAGGGTFEEGVMVADAALRAGSPRGLLEAAVDLAGPRQAFRRIEGVIAFAHPGSEGAVESRGRTTMLRIGVEPPILQRGFLLPSGRRAHPDFWFPTADAAAEADGDVKYLDPAMAPDGAGVALIAEKRREDELRSLLRGLARFGWRQSSSTGLLRPVLARAGILAATPRARLSDYAAVARSARPRGPATAPVLEESDLRFIPRRALAAE